MLAALSTAIPAAVQVARKDSIAPADVCRITKPLPRTPAFPLGVSRATKDRATASLRREALRDRFGRELPAAGELSQVLTLFERQPAFAGVGALHRATVFRVLAQPELTGPFEDRPCCDAVARGQERVGGRAVVLAELLVHRKGIGLPLPRSARWHGKCAEPTR